MLDIPDSSLRRYCRENKRHLSDYANRPGKRRRYTDQDIITLGKLRKFTKEHKTPEEIDQLLTLTDQPPEPPDSALALLPTVLTQFDDLRAQLAQLAQQNADQAERLTRLEDWLQTPWYKRIGRKPPT